VAFLKNTNFIRVNYSRNSSNLPFFSFSDPVALTQLLCIPGTENDGGGGLTPSSGGGGLIF
jgi:hypothetical protein